MWRCYLHALVDGQAVKWASPLTYEDHYKGLPELDWYINQGAAVTLEEES